MKAIVSSKPEPELWRSVYMMDRISRGPDDMIANMAVSPELAPVLAANRTIVACNACLARLKQTDARLRCARCKNAIYCSAECAPPQLSPTR